MVEMCFPAGTPVRTSRGYVPIEDIRPGDLVACVSDRDPDGPVEFKPVERIFHNPPARLMGVHLGDQVIRATHAHRFWVHERGWVPAEELAVGDQLRTPSGEFVPVTDLFDNGEVEPVYNLRVADNHTYFVATPNRQLAVLVHNDYRDGNESYFYSAFFGDGSVVLHDWENRSLYAKQLAELRADAAAEIAAFGDPARTRPARLHRRGLPRLGRSRAQPAMASRHFSVTT